jgi:hypothetical protein cdivTM_12249
MILLMKRAWLSVSRRLGKTTVLLLIMTVIFTALVSEATVRGAMANLRENVGRGVPAGFVVRPGGGELSTADAETVRGVSGVTDHNYVRTLPVVPKDTKLVEMAGGVQLSEDVVPEAAMTGVTRSDLISGFTTKRYELVEGRHLTASDQHSAVIHKDLADKNGLKLGDQLTLTRDGKSVTVTVVGLFTGSNERSSLPSEMAENTCFTDMASSDELAPSAGLTEAQYLVSSASELGSTIDRAKGLPLAWDNLQVEDNAKSFAGVLSGIATVESLLNLLLAGVSLASIAVLVFVLVFWIRGRVHEIGIMLSIGTSKGRLLSQFLAELTMIAILAGGLAFLTAGQVSHILGDFLIGQAAGSGEASTPKPSIATASLIDFGRAWLLGYGVVLLSAVVAMIPMLRLKPKQILSKMS